ncbi:MAG TPA: hypothetical protein VGV35_17240 [Bryobacteraceae bacterium]|nr:hypothetical protein [Bryobacteraceae bacterium]
MRHLDDEQLLRYADGELPARTAGEVRSHLEACWQCRAQLEEMQETVSQCVGYRKNVLQRHLPPPPAPWADIYQRFAEVDATIEKPGLLHRAAQALRWPVENPRRWVPALAVLMIVVGVYRFRLTPSVQAAELLRKAVAAADNRPVKTHRIEIRTRDHRLTRTAGPNRQLASIASDAETLQSLQALFVAANYDWNDPLSAKSYQAWRSQLAEKTDEVVQDRDSYRVRTDAASGELKDASLTLKTPDLQPVEGRFEFRNGEWVEITAVADETTAPAAEVAAGTASPETHASLPPAVTPALATPSASPTIADELHVMAALHQVGADLGDPIEISRTGSEILVSGAGIAPARQQEIREAIGSQPQVVVRFSASTSSPAPAAVRPERNATDNPAGADLRQMQSRLAEQIGGRANFEQLATAVLDLNEPMMSRVYALRRLAERFPADAESQLSPTDRQLLRQMQREHIAALRQQTSELDRLLKPMRASAHGSFGSNSGALSAAAWQPATEELFQSARRVEKLLAVIFGAAPGESADEQLPGQLLASLAQLRAKVEVYDRLSTKMER